MINPLICITTSITQLAKLVLKKKEMAQEQLHRRFLCAKSGVYGNGSPLIHISYMR